MNELNELKEFYKDIKNILDDSKNIYKVIADIIIDNHCKLIFPNKKLWQKIALYLNIYMQQGQDIVIGKNSRVMI